MLHFVMDFIRPDPRLPDEEIQFKVRELAPLRISVDQDTLDFGVMFGKTLVEQLSGKTLRGTSEDTEDAQEGTDAADALDSIGPHIR